MAVFTIAGLTIREAVRRKTLLGSLLLGALVLCLSLLLLRIRYTLHERLFIPKRHYTVEHMAMDYAIGRSIITLLCLNAIRTLGSLFAVLLAGGSISGEIERGLLAVILPKPIPRWQILLGKWIGLNLILVGSVLVWTAMVWASLTWQTRDNGTDLTPLLRASPYLALYPVVIGTLALSLSTFAQRIFGTSLALALSAFGWFDGILNGLGKAFDSDMLYSLANLAGLVVPQGYIAWWVENTVEDTIAFNPFQGRPGGGPHGQQFVSQSPQFLKEWGVAHLHIQHLDGIYVACYIIVVFLLGAVVFKKRDVS